MNRLTAAAITVAAIALIPAVAPAARSADLQSQTFTILQRIVDLQQQIISMLQAQVGQLQAQLDWLGVSDLPWQVGGGRIWIAQEDNAVPICSISSPRGPWDHYQMHDLPRGHCSGAQACTLWTKDSCPGTDYPGPGIKWKCACDSGTWHCDELERSETACLHALH